MVLKTGICQITQIKKQIKHELIHAYIYRFFGYKNVKLVYLLYYINENIFDLRPYCEKIGVYKGIRRILALTFHFFNDIFFCIIPDLNK